MKNYLIDIRYPFRQTSLGQAFQRKNLFGRLLSCASVVLLATTESRLLAQDEAEDIFELSPFTVEADQIEGYQATNTLAGSRLKTPLRDVGSAISILTDQFFEDTGATDAATALSYGLNTEIGGVFGNFAGSGFDSRNQRSDTDDTRVNPQGNQRIRGLGVATLTRDFYLTEIPFDSYNSSRVTINRGPNAILFGVGTPGGILNNSLNTANLGNNFGEIQIRLGKNETHRESIDINRVLVEDRIALRISSLHDETFYQQDPAFKRDDRIYASLKAVLLKNDDSELLGPTILRGHVENGQIVSNPANVLPPNNIYHTWWTGVKVDYEKYTGVAVFDRLLPPNFVPKFTANTMVQTSVPDMLTVADIPNFIQAALVYGDASQGPTPGFSAMFPNAHGFQGRIPVHPSGGIFDIFFTRSPELERYSAGFVTPSINDRKIFDYRNKLFSGNLDRVEQDFTAYNATLEQLFFDDQSAGIELAFDHQEWSRYSRLIVNSEVAAVFGNKDIAIDISEFHGNGDPNPNVGRAVVRLDRLGDFNLRDVDREAVRATAFYELDLTQYGDILGQWLGHHTITGFLSSQEFTIENRRMANTWISDRVNMRTQAFGGRQGGWGRRVQGFVYVSDDLRNTSGPQDVRIQQMNITAPEEGDEFTLWYQDRTDNVYKAGTFAVESMLNGGNIIGREIDSRAITVQSRFLDDHLVTLFGWRNDESTTFEQLTQAQIAELTGNSNRRNAAGALKEENFNLQDDPSAVSKGDTFTSSVVLHLPDEWVAALPGNSGLSLHYGESENFNPAGLRRSAFGEVIEPPTGTTEEYGFSVELSDKIIARFNWFETTLNNADAGLDVSRAVGLVAAWVNRGFIQPQNEDMSWEEAKAFMTQVTGDVIPNINSYDDLYNTLLGFVPAEILAQENFRIVDLDGTLELQREGIPAQIATAGLLAEGFEIDLVGQITPNWRLMLNIGKQETTQSGSAVEYKRLADMMQQRIDASGLWLLSDSPVVGEITTYGRRWSESVLAPLNSVLAKDGTKSLEQRKWRTNLVTNYTFDQGSSLKGFSLGGAIRWQDKAAVGYGQLVSPDDGSVIPDLNTPYFAPSELNGDVWFSYNRKLTDNIDWKIQLNVRNAFGDNDDIPFKINPDGQVAVIRIPNERFWWVSNKFSF